MINHWYFERYDLIIDKVDKQLIFNILNTSFIVEDRWLMSKLDKFASLVSKGISDELIRPLTNDIKGRLEQILKDKDILKERKRER